jgi:uncharacterized protein (DUF433 family)
MKKSIAGATLAAMMATASVAVYAQDATAQPPAVTDTNAVGPGFGGPGLRGPGPMGGLSIVADTLGIDQTELITELQAGKTIAQIAADKNVSTDTIVNAIVTADQDRLTTAVTDGRLTQAQADARLALVKADAEALLDKTFDAQNFPGAGQRDGFRMGANVMSVVATALGIDETELRTELQSGKTIAEIAADKNVATDTIVAAVIAAQKEKLDAAVTAGTLTQDQADARLADITTHAQDLLDQTMTGRGPGMGGPGMGGPGGMDQGNGGFGGRGHGGPGGQGNGGPGQPPPAGNGNAPAAPESTSTPNA